MWIRPTWLRTVLSDGAVLLRPQIFGYYNATKLVRFTKNRLLTSMISVSVSFADLLCCLSVSSKYCKCFTRFLSFRILSSSCSSLNITFSSIILREKYMNIQGCIQKFPDWPPGAGTAHGTALCH